MGNHQVLSSAASRIGRAAIMIVTAVLVLAGAVYFLPRVFSSAPPVGTAPSLAISTETVLPSATPTNTAANNPARGIIASFTADALTKVANFTATPKFTGTPPTATMTATFTRTSTPTKTFTPTKTPTRTLTPTITTSPVPSATRTFAPPPSTGMVCGHPLDTPFGGNIKFLLHRILSGENLTIYADTYGTTTAAILAVNYRLPLPVWADWVVVIPFQTDSVGNIPPFEPYQAVDARISLDELARQLNTDAASLQAYNDFQEPCASFSGWLLVPRATP